jgi:hypothetical protein
MKVLLLGSGAPEPNPLRKLLIRLEYEGGLPSRDDVILTRLDSNPDCKPDVLWDLNVKPWPFEDNSFDEVHAYNVMEHLGRQGDAKAFFDEHYEIWRILRRGGSYLGCCPTMRNPWVLAEPSHTRVLLPHTFNFLHGRFMDTQLGVTSSSDFRGLWRGDLRLIKVWNDYNSEDDWAWHVVAFKEEEFLQPLNIINGLT